MTAIHSYGPVSLTWIEGKGRGVVANRDLAVGEEPVHSPLVVIPTQQLDHVAKTIFNDYVFHWPYDPDGTPNEESDQAAMSCGLGCMLNHSNTPNCEWDFRAPDLQHVARVVQPVAAGEELTFNSGWDPEKREQLVESRTELAVRRSDGRTVHHMAPRQPYRVQPLRGGSLLVSPRGEQIALTTAELAVLQPQLRRGLIRRTRK